MDIGSLSLAIDLYAPEQVVRDLKQIDAAAKRVADNAEKAAKEQEGYWRALYKFLKQKIKETLQAEKAAQREKIKYEREFQALVRAEARETHARNMENARWWMAKFKADATEAKSIARARELAIRAENKKTHDDNMANARWWMAKMRSDANERIRLEREIAKAKRETDRIKTSSVTDRFFGMSASQRALAKAELAAYAEDERRKTAMTRRAEAERLKIRQASVVRFRTTLGAGVGIAGGLGGTIAGVAALREIVQASNALQTLEQRLAQVSNGAGQTRYAMRNLASASQALRVPVQDLGELYVKLRQSNAAVGLSMGQTMTVTKAFAAALRLSGATGQAASSALLQFGQAMAKGKLDGDEFRTVAENASEVLRILERQLGKTRGELLEMREKGLLTAKMMADALTAEADQLLDRMRNLPPTLDQAAISFRNSIIMMVGGSNSLRTAMGNVAQGIINVGNFLAGNGGLIGSLVKSATAGVALAIAVRGLNMAFAAAAASGGLLNAVAARFSANPYMMAFNLIITGAYAVAVALDLIKNKTEDLMKQRSQELAQPVLEAAGRSFTERGRKRMVEEMEKFNNEVLKPRLQAEADANAVLAQKLKERQDIYAKYGIASPKELDFPKTMKRIYDSFGDKEGGMVVANLRKRLATLSTEIGTAQRNFNSLKTSADEAKGALSTITEELLAAEAGTADVGIPTVTTKEQKDTLDGYIQSLGQLARSGPTAALAQRELNRIFDDQTRVVSATTRALENDKLTIEQRTVAINAQADAMRRQNEIMQLTAAGIPDLSNLAAQIGEAIDKSLGNTLPAQNMKRIDLLIDKYDELQTVITDNDRFMIKSALRQVESELSLISLKETLTNKELEYVAALVKRQQALAGILNKELQAGKTTEGDGEGDEDDEFGKNFEKRMRRQMYNLLRAGPADLITSFFEGLGERAEDGGNTVAEKMRNALGNIFSGAGSNLLQQGVNKLIPIVRKAMGSLFTAIAGPTTVLGKFIDTISGILSKNPLLGGLALVAIGGAMLAYGKALGGSARSAMGMYGGEGGGIGGLGLGGGPTAPFTPVSRSGVSPMAGIGAPASTQQSVTVNATIIGPNDPQAQRQIAQLMDNATRRGLVQGGGVRT